MKSHCAFKELISEANWPEKSVHPEGWDGGSSCKSLIRTGLKSSKAQPDVSQQSYNYGSCCYPVSVNLEVAIVVLSRAPNDAIS